MQRSLEPDPVSTGVGIGEKMHFFIMLVLFMSTSLISKIYASEIEKITVIGGKTPYPYLLLSPNDFLNKTDLRENNSLSTDDLWSNISNLNVSGGSNKIRYIQIRGIGERSQYENTPNNSVGFFLDHIDLSSTPNAVNTNFLESTSLYKGSNSFFYGSSNLAGTLVFKTKNPEFVNSKIETQVDLSSFKTRSLNLSYSTPISLSSSIGLSLKKIKSDSFIQNKFLDNKSTNSQDELYLNANSQHSLNLVNIQTSHLFFKQENGYDVWNFTPHKFETISDKPGSDDQNVFANSLEINALLNRFTKLSLISSQTHTKSFYSYDEDWGNNPYWNDIAGWDADYNYNKSYQRTNNKFHNKLLIQTSLKNSQKITTGFHFYKQSENSKIKSFKDNSQRENLTTQFDQNSYSLIFGYSKIYKNLKFSADARFEQVNLEFNNNNNSFSSDSHENLVGLNKSILYSINQKNLISFKCSRGFKPGGFNPDLNLSEARQIFKSEKLNQYEVFYEYFPYNLKATAFLMLRNNQQVTTSFQDDPLDPSSFTLFIDNAAKTKNYGLELSSELFRNKKLNFSANLGILKAKFSNYEREGIDFSKRDQAHSPLYTFTLKGIYKLSSKLSLSAILTGRDSFYFSNGHNKKSKPYSLLNAHIDYVVNNKLQLRFWGRNILDKKYVVRGFYFANEPPVWEPKLYLQSGSPVELGLSLSYQI